MELKIARVHVLRAMVLLALIGLLHAGISSAQTSVAAGAIVGTIADPAGAVVPNASVTITSSSTGQKTSLATSAAGVYNSGPLIPGNYAVRVQAKGFKTAELTVTVEVGSVAPGNLKLQVGEASQTVEVQASSVQVNTEQATIQGVVTPQQIESLPINGRNFLDLAQLEPGVQIQDGQNFDPTKNGFMSISIGGRAGRTARIELDGLDISDENVGTTTQNIASSAIQEFQIAQSSLDLSSSLTSSGTVNVTTKSGSNSLHGEGFYGFRDARAGFAGFPGGQKPNYQRNQMGGSLGGAIIKNKLFFFGDVERTKQDFGNPVSFGAPFNDLSGSYSAPFRDNDDLGRLDWTIGPNMRMFYRFTYNNNSVLKPGNNYSPYVNRDNTPAHAWGFDFTTGGYTHSIRAGYSKFVNSIDPAVGGGLINPDPNLYLVSTNGLQTGPNILAPQKTIQSNRQLKYDGSKLWKNHIFRYGGAVNRLGVYAFAAFGALAPEVFDSPTPQTEAAILANPSAYRPALMPGGLPTDNPLNYPVSSFLIYNGAGAFSEKPAFGSNVGGYFDTRLEFYVGDAWKLKPNLTVNYGVHYVRDSNRNNNDLPADPTLTAALNQFGPGLGNKANSPNLNFSPEIGLAWDPWNNGKTVFRAGAGLYYENTLFNDILFDRVLRLRKGEFYGSQTLCGGTGQVQFPDGTSHTSSDGLDIATQICGNAPGSSVNGVSVGQAISDLQKAFQASTAAIGPASNGLYEPNLGSTLGLMLAPNFVSPRSVQLNVGVQRQIGRGTILSVDYVHNNGTHFLLGVDANHVGAARNLNVNNALAAINNTVTAVGCPAATSAGASSQAAVNCYLAAVGPSANMTAFAGNGLDTSGAFPNPTAAFPGNNPAVGQGVFFYPIGDSRYDGLQTSLRSNFDNPLPGVRHINMVVSYALSRLQSNYPFSANLGSILFGDQDFLNSAVDNDHPNRYFGPAGQDRTHQLSFGPILEIAHGPKISMIGHIDSPLPLTLTLPQSGGGGQPGEIFRTDVTGDGSFGALSQGGDIVPGSNVGAFGRSISPGDLNAFINRYNSTYAGKLTPAGQALVNANLFTEGQLASLGAVTPTIQTAPPGNVGMGWLKSIDLRVAWPIRVRERLTIEPSFSAFNAFNFANFDNSLIQLSGVLQASPGSSVNAVTGFTANCGNVPTCRAGDRVGPGSGVFSLGSPRELEFGLRVTF